MNFTIGHLEPGHDLEAFLEQHDVLGGSYRHHGTFTDEELAAITARDIRSRLKASEISAFSCISGNEIAAIGVCSRLDWDSTYFGMPMARLELWRLPGVEAEAVRGLVERVIQDSRERFGVRHIHCRADSGDYAYVNALISSRFALMDAQRVYVATRKRKRAPERELYKPHPCKPEVAPDLLELFSSVEFDSRYTRDKALPGELTERMYRHWMATMIGLPESEREIYVLERNGRVVAAGAGRYLDFSGSGIGKEIMTDGIFGSAKGFSGSYIGITRAVVDVALERGCSFVELKVSANNYPANRVLQSLGYEGIPLFYYFHRSF